MNTNHTFALTLNEDPTLSLNGIATYNHMGKDYYIIAHYSALSCSSASDCEMQTTPARYRLKMVTSRWTSHSYSLVWQRELTSNNSQTQLADEDAKKLYALTHLPETQLTSGDTIDVYFDGKATKIFINGAPALTTPGKHLFNYIARIWIGPVPPSRQFKADMLKGHQAQHSVKLVYEFEAIIPLADRLNLLAQWQQKKADSAQTQKTNDAQALTNSDFKNTKIQSTHITTAPVAIQLDATQLTADKVGVALNTQQATAELNKINTVKNNSIENNLTKNHSVKNKLVKNKAQMIDAKKERKRAQALTKEQQYALLEWQINTAIFNQVNYPNWAKNLNKTGKVSVSFTVDALLKEANIISISPKQTGLLTDAVIEAIHKTFPANSKLQALTQGKPVTLTYHHVFSLSRKTEKPLAPALLLEKNLINSKLISPYLTNNPIKPASSNDELREYLSQKVKYPYWAKSFNYAGEVKAKITLTPEGFVDNVKILKGSPHAGFNQAIIAAVKNAEPFPVAPNSKVLTFEYQHTFKP